MSRSTDAIALDLGCRLAAGEVLDEALAGADGRGEAKMLAEIAERVKADNQAALARQTDGNEA